MRIGDVLYFSPNHQFRDLNFDDPETIVVAFADRVKGFYFQAAEQLIETGHAFGAGLITCAAIDFVAHTCSEEKVEAFLGGSLGLDTEVAAKVWVLFRHGLAHEGRVKPFGQFSFETVLSSRRTAMQLSSTPIFCCDKQKRHSSRSAGERQ